MLFHIYENECLKAEAVRVINYLLTHKLNSAFHMKKEFFLILFLMQLNKLYISSRILIILKCMLLFLLISLVYSITVIRMLNVSK